jgi:hypothetical protein
MDNWNNTARWPGCSNCLLHQTLLEMRTHASRHQRIPRKVLVEVPGNRPRERFSRAFLVLLLVRIEQFLFD